MAAAIIDLICKQVLYMLEIGKIKNIFLKLSNDETYFYRGPTWLAPFYKIIYLHKLPQCNLSAKKIMGSR